MVWNELERSVLLAQHNAFPGGTTFVNISCRHDPFRIWSSSAFAAQVALTTLRQLEKFLLQVAFELETICDILSSQRPVKGYGVQKT